VEIVAIFFAWHLAVKNNLSPNFVELNTLWLKLVLRALTEYLQVARREMQFLFCPNNVLLLPPLYYDYLQILIVESTHVFALA
jgi:hypothetical protein